MINKKIIHIMYATFVVVYFVFMICSIIYRTNDGVEMMAGMGIVSTASYVLLIKKANEQEKEKQKKESKS